MKDCVSLETAKKLQDAGVEIDTPMAWVRKDKKEWELRDKYTLDGCYRKEDVRRFEIIPTPTTNEMLEWLPEYKITDDGDAYLQIKKRDGFYYPSYFWADGMDYGNTFEYGFEIKDKLPQEALAKLCLWVRKEGHK